MASPTPCGLQHVARSLGPASVPAAFVVTGSSDGMMCDLSLQPWGWIPQALAPSSCRLTAVDSVYPATASARPLGLAQHPGALRPGPVPGGAVVFASRLCPPAQQREDMCTSPTLLVRSRELRLSVPDPILAGVTLQLALSAGAHQRVDGAVS